MNPPDFDWADALPTKVGEAWLRRDGDETAVFDPKSGRLYRLNDPALAIWEICDGTTTASEMAEALSELTGFDRERSMRQVVETLDSLLDQELISVSR